jgi:transcriptional regulator with XRE-family HTH domain
VVDESRQWVEFGRWLAEQREERGLRRREAARRAKVTEAQWRDLETGRKEAVGGIRLLPNPSAEVLERVAGVLDLPVEELLTRVGRPQRPVLAAVPRSRNGDGPAGGGVPLQSKLRRLSPRDRAVVEGLIDLLLENDER